MSSDDRERFGRLHDGLHDGRTLAGAGLLRPHRPDRLIGAARQIARWGQSSAGAYAAGAQLRPGELAVIDDLGKLTFAEVHERTSRLAAALVDEGIGQGDSVALMCRNHRGFVETVVALSKLGANTLLLNTGFAGPQLVDVVERENPSALVFDQEFTDLMAGALERRQGFVAWVDQHEHGERATLEQLIERGGSSELVPPAEPGRTTILTSGTTGTPKGASRSSPGIAAAVSILSEIPLRTRERVLVSAPLFHQWGYAHFTLGLLLGSRLVMQRRFDPEAALAIVERERVSCWPMVPVMCQRILELPNEALRRYDTSSLRTVPLSGSALPGELTTRFMDEFGDVLYNLYGSTEVAWASVAGPNDLRRAPGTAGRPPRGTTLRIVNDNGEQLRRGETGRIFVGNDLLFEGYSGGGSKETLNGLMATGDVGHFDDDGRLFVDCRDDDMIISGGENVFPQEVEDILARHERVREAAVIGVEDEQFGQRLKAFVVTSATISEDALKAYVKENLASYKVPREIAFIDALPRSEQGKVLKRELGDR